MNEIRIVGYIDGSPTRATKDKFTKLNDIEDGGLNDMKHT